MIRTRNLRKSYAGMEALRGIDLDVKKGDVYGFIGPNGAGKTTTIRILTTLLEPTAGEAWVAELPVWESKQEVRGLIGYMPDSFGVYRDMTVTEYMHFFAAAYGIPNNERVSLVGGLLELTDLTYKEDALIDSLSRGMQQRLGLARTLVHDPEVLILDEPASGLDPRARIEVRGILQELQNMGKTILLSSHILSELESICNRVGILEQGTLVAQGSISEILAQTKKHDDVWIRTDDDERAATVLRELPDVLSATFTDGRVEVQAKSGTDLALLASHIIKRELALRHLERREPSLEEMFMNLTEGLVQ